eukprot:c8140_g1_i1.p1 GENE.c8140_g1_i1~~c8140_g1_i1.p1  ORF type:complete len:506 (+),score=135.67 c8140_g1_i1:1-1518(+)
MGQVFATTFGMERTRNAVCTAFAVTFVLGCVCNAAMIDFKDKSEALIAKLPAVEAKAGVGAKVGHKLKSACVSRGDVEDEFGQHCELTWCDFGQYMQFYGLCQDAVCAKCPPNTYDPRPDFSNGSGENQVCLSTSPSEPVCLNCDSGKYCDSTVKTCSGNSSCTALLTKSSTSSSTTSPTATPTAAPTPTARSATADCTLTRGFFGNSTVVNHQDLGTVGRVVTTGYTTPVVFASPPTIHGGNPCVVRVQSLTTSFRLWLAEHQKSDVWHTLETVQWLVLESGFTLGCNLVVGKVTVNSNAWQSVDLSGSSGPLGLRPWIFTTIQSTNNGASPSASKELPPPGLRGFVKTRLSLSENSATSFRIKLETNEGSVTQPTQETVGYLAINSGCTSTQTSGDNTNFTVTCATRYGTLSLGGVVYDYALGITNTKSSSMGQQIVNFGKTFKNVPILLANMQSSRGADPAELRTRLLSTTQYVFVVEEDQAKDVEVKHTREWVAWLALGSF